ncbi:MAG: hypothetical protein ACYST3_01510 [Planctomycetota bacterium]|jgi:hypothetical protein
MLRLLANGFVSAFFCNPRFYQTNLVVLIQTDEPTNLVLIQTDEPTNRQRRIQTTPRRSPIVQLRDQAKGVKRIPGSFGHAVRSE